MILPASQTSVMVLIQPPALLLPCLGWDQAGERRWKPKAGCFLQQTFNSRIRLENPHLLVMNPLCNSLNTQTRHACGIPEIVAN